MRKPLIKLKNFIFLISCEIYFFDTGNIKVFVSLYNSVNAPPIPTTNTLPKVLSLRMLKNISAIGAGSISSIKNIPLLIAFKPNNFLTSWYFDISSVRLLIFNLTAPNSVLCKIFELVNFKAIGNLIFIFSKSFIFLTSWALGTFIPDVVPFHVKIISLLK